MIKNEPNWKKESERVVYMESVLHADQGQGEVKQHLSIDEPVRVRTADLTKSLSRIRVRTIVEEDKSVRCQNNNQFEVYSKKMKTVQEKVDGDNSSPSTYEEPKYESNSETEVSEDEEPGCCDPDNNNLTDDKRWTKNIVDKILDRQLIHEIMFAAVFIIAGLALGRTF